MNAKLFSKAEEQADYCRIFGNSRRVMILWTLGTEEMSVGDIASEVGASIQNTSQHLRLMKDKGILKSRRDGQTIYYHAVDGDCLMKRD